jgi:release factor glutamine methyltransferase
MASTAAQINQEIIKRLSKLFEKSEAEAICRELWRHFSQWPFPGDEVPEKTIKQIEAALLRLETGEPLQYILETAWFCGMEWKVGPGVLIPRPETEELVHWILATEDQEKKSVIDLGTGSGCIAVSLAKLGKWNSVYALDVSGEALEIARYNAENYGLKISWSLQDILEEKPFFHSVVKWDIMVSNPPYVLQSESAEMEKQVLDFEPQMALFVPDGNPLVFYEAIAKAGINQLKEGGSLFFEINPKLGSEICSLLAELGYTHIEHRQDMFGKDRMVRARKG